MLFPPRNINALYGYRTNRSMKNQTNWTAANKLASVIFVIGSATLMVQKLIFLMFFPMRAKLNAVLFLVILLTIFVTIFIVVESHLKKLSKNQ